MRKLILAAVAGLGLWSAYSFAHNNVVGYAYDKYENEFMGGGSDLHSAQQAALEDCREGSRVPKTCHLEN